MFLQHVKHFVTDNVVQMFLSKTGLFQKQI